MFYQTKGGIDLKVAIIGTTGYGGAELLRILFHHPEFKIQSIHSTRGEAPISNEYPHLNGILDQQLEGIDPHKIASQSDIIFLATPSGISGSLVEAFLETDIKIIDLSGDLRLKNLQDYEKWYKHAPVQEHVVQQAVYGLSEWNHDKIAHANVIANPGCYPTATLLGLAPIIKEDLVELNSIIIDAKSGVSGAGRTASKTTHFAEMNENFKIYKVNEHQHIPEIEQQLLEWNSAVQPITFSTHLLPVTRGIMATMYVQLKESINTDKLIDLYKQSYESHPFVRVRNHGQFPALKEVYGSNYCDIGIHVDERTGRATIVSIIDNLMKGAAGQAVQNANIMNGFDETLGLNFVPIYP